MSDRVESEPKAQVGKDALLSSFTWPLAGFIYRMADKMGSSVLPVCSCKTSLSSLPGGPSQNANLFHQSYQKTILLARWIIYSLIVKVASCHFTVYFFFRNSLLGHFMLKAGRAGLVQGFMEEGPF